MLLLAVSQTGSLNRIGSDRKHEPEARSPKEAILPVLS